MIAIDVDCLSKTQFSLVKPLERGEQRSELEVKFRALWFRGDACAKRIHRVFGSPRITESQGMAYAVG